MCSGVWKFPLLVLFGLALANSNLAFADDVEAGLLATQAAAEQKCPQLCSGKRWAGQWSTIRPGEMSACQCGASGKFPPAPSSSSLPTGFRELPGRATDIAIGANGDAFIIGTDRVPGGYNIYQWNGKSWRSIKAGGVRIAVGPDGSPWIVNIANNVLHYVDNQWVSFPGTATDIGVGAGGDVYIIGTNRMPGGYGIYELGQKTKTWKQLPGGAVRIAVARNGIPWVVTDNGDVFLYAKDWQQVTGIATDIGVGGVDDNHIWITRTNPGRSGFGLYEWSGSVWSPIGHGATNISVGPNGMVMFTNTEGKIFAREPSAPR